MACFVVPLVQAVTTGALRKWGRGQGFAARHLSSLELMLWGGTLMLIVDHVINCELRWKFPFFTALATEGVGMVMLREMLTVGVPMSLLITLVWLVYAYVKERKNAYSA